MSDFSTPAGWYPDGNGWERRWDGSGWTEERRRMAEPTQVRPATPPATPPAAPAATPPVTAAPQGAPPQGPPQQYAVPQGQPRTAGHSYGHVPSGHSHETPAQTPYPATYGSSFPGYSSGPPKKSKLWLWLTLGLVLLLCVGAGVALAVVQPWKDDDDSTSTKGTDPDEPTGNKAIQGDITGDDKGDALYYVYYDYDDVKKVTATSNGNGFELSELAVEPYDEPNELYVDWDGDGVNEKLAWKFVASGKQITLSSSDPDFPGEQTFTVSLSSLKEYGDVEIRVVDGDFDGDGDEDLAVVGPNDKVVDVSVLTNDGKGTFAAPVLWLSIPNTVIDATKVTAGDFDKDGDADLWAELPAERLTDESYTKYYSGDRGFALLTSSGTTFTLGAINKSSVYPEAFLVGDVTGDGTVNIIGVDTNSVEEELTVTVYDVSSGQLRPVTGFTGKSKVGSRSLQGAIISDVDGDGKGDVVFVVKDYDDTKFSGVQVMKSTGAIFESGLVWAETPTCPDKNCRIEFVGSRRY